MILRGSTELFGVIGYPIRHSLSPVFQNAAFSYLGIDAVYVPFEIKPENLSRALEGLKRAGVRGLNVTIPHKEAIVRLSDNTSDEVKDIGAANTLKLSEEYVEAYNTDWIGFLRAAQEITDLKGRRVLVLGAGGSSRAVLYALKKVGAKVILWNRTREKALRLGEEFGVEAVNEVEEGVLSSEVIVNTTSVGLREDDPPLFNYDLLTPEQVVIDIIYKETSLIRAAKEKGCRFTTGFPMLVYQGAESFRIWTGCEPPVKVMKLSLREYGYPTELTKTP